MESNTEVLVYLYSGYGKMLFFPSHFKILHLFYITAWFTVQEQLLISISIYLSLLLTSKDDEIAQLPSCSCILGWHYALL